MIDGQMPGKAQSHERIDQLKDRKNNKYDNQIKINKLIAAVALMAATSANASLWKELQRQEML